MTINLASESAVSALLGGLIIGISASVLLLFNGRVAGISGITNRLLNHRASDFGWRIWFVLGLLVGGLVLSSMNPNSFNVEASTPFWRLAVAGLLVGFGSSQGSGCTSGHGVCGISRFSKRSITATVTFMITGFITVFLLRVLGGMP